MRRHAIGIIALLLLACAVVFLIFPIGNVAWQEPLGSACCRVGALMAALWLAYPDMHRVPTWLWGTLFAILVVVAIRPRTVFLAVPIIVALAILRPRIGRS